MHNVSRPPSTASMTSRWPRRNSVKPNRGKKLEISSTGSVCRRRVGNSHFGNWPSVRQQPESYRVAARFTRTRALSMYARTMNPFDDPFPTNFRASVGRPGSLAAQQSIRAHFWGQDSSRSRARFFRQWPPTLFVGDSGHRIETSGTLRGVLREMDPADKLPEPLADVLSQYRKKRRMRR